MAKIAYNICICVERVSLYGPPALVNLEKLLHQRFDGVISGFGWKNSEYVEQVAIPHYDEQFAQMSLDDLEFNLQHNLHTMAQFAINGFQNKKVIERLRDATIVAAARAWWHIHRFQRINQAFVYIHRNGVADIHDWDDPSCQEIFKSGIVRKFWPSNNITFSDSIHTTDKIYGTA